MDSTLNFGVQVILFLQSLGSWLATPFLLITNLGNEYFYLFFAPAVYWCWDDRLGLRLGLALMLSGSINCIFKYLFHGPRPYWVDSRVVAYTSETGFGIPSGHAQNAVVVWGILAAWIKRRWAQILAVILIFLIGISRMYLGVHFPHDVLLGWIIGGLILTAMLAWENRFMTWFVQFNPAVQMLMVFGFSLLVILLGALARLSLSGWTVPAIWFTNAAQATPGAAPISPLALSDMISPTGAFFGLACGAILIKMWGGFNTDGTTGQRVLRFLVGVAGVGIIWYGLDVLFPSGESLLALTLRYLRYSLVGLWITGFAPLLFFQMKLATPRIWQFEKEGAYDG